MPPAVVNGSVAATPTWHVDAQSASESASLRGHQALTPIIAGSICGSFVGAGWLLGALLLFNKRQRRRRRAKKVALGLKAPKAPKPPPHAGEKFVIPPDPAILSGVMRPGDFAFPEDSHERHHKAWGKLRHAKTVQEIEDKEREVHREHTEEEEERGRPEARHSSSVPVPKHQNGVSNPLPNEQNAYSNSM